MKNNYFSKSVAQTARIAQKLAEYGILKPRRRVAVVIALEGELGAGKTTFVQAFAKAVGVQEHVVSPTFLILRRYTLHGSRYTSLIHIDAYRLKDHTELATLGI